MSTQPGTLNFLDTLDQIRVQRILDCLKSHEVKEVETQTSFEPERLQPIVEKSVQTEHANYSCNCSSTLAKHFEELNKKLDLFIAKQEPYTLLTTPNKPKFEFNNDECEYAGSVSPSPTFELQGGDVFKNQQEQQQKYNSNNQEALTTINLAECSLPGMLQITPSPPPSTSPLINDIRTAIFEETYKESSSMSNFAKNLVFKLFNSQELQGSNCSGMKGKKSLEKDHRMSLIKEVVLKKYPVEDQKKSWAMCRKAIDSAIRHSKHLK